ncbi:hypothetical protein TcYC6_0057080 [Trypanosoma cruzi]|nr:hypothetical protein TcYC6_0057080 [Trypanosoma cruzi]
MKAPTATDVVRVSHQCGVTVRAFLLPTPVWRAVSPQAVHRPPLSSGDGFRPAAVGSSLERMRAECSGEMLQKRRWLVQSPTVQYSRPQSSDSPHPAHAVFIRSCWSRAS